MKKLKWPEFEGGHDGVGGSSPEKLISSFLTLYLCNFFVLQDAEPLMCLFLSCFFKNAKYTIKIIFFMHILFFALIT